MTSYQIADGHDNEVSFAALTPQPSSEAVRAPELVFYGDGSAEFVGAPYVDLRWSALTRSQYNTLRTQLGISDTVASNEVTIKLRLNDNTFDDYNGTVIYLRTERRMPYGWRDFTVRVKDLVAT